MPPAGKGGGYEVILAVVRRAMSGIIDGPPAQLEISQALGEDALLLLAPEELDPDEVGTVGPVAAETVVAGEPLGASGSSSGSAAASTQARDAATTRLEDLEPLASEGTVVVDMMVLYTNGARIQAGGSAGNQGDDISIRSLIYGAAEDINVTFANSLIDAEVRVVHIGLFDEIQPSGNGPDDLADFRRDLTVQGLRDLHQADVVSLIMPDEIVGCGLAFTQRPGCGDQVPIVGCGLGQNFNAFAYNWVARDCVRGGRYAFVHEFLHNAGAEHDLENAVPRESASFPFAFGHFIDATNRTMMAQGQIGFQRKRALNASNPDVSLNGSPTGTFENNNAEAVRHLLPYMARYRGTSTCVFKDGFERGDTLFWALD